MFMDVINAEWIRKRLGNERGKQARLAEAMGIDNDKMSRILAGKRKVQAKEVPGVLAFFAAEQEASPEQALLQKIQELSDERRDALESYLSHLLSQQEDHQAGSSQTEE